MKRRQGRAGAWCGVGRLLGVMVVAVAGMASTAMAGSPALPADLRAATWRDSDGSEFKFSSARASRVVVTMAYTACRQVCSPTILVLNDLQQKLDELKQPAEFIVVTLDPQNDSPAEWLDYRKRRGLTRSNWRFLTGSESDTRRLARLLEINSWTYHEHIVHDFRIVVFDPHWRTLANVDWARMGQLPQALGLAARP